MKIYQTTRRHIPDDGNLDPYNSGKVPVLNKLKHHAMNMYGGVELYLHHSSRH
jgi:hypothetical protein